jgi:Ni/Fe-hydrogenase 1 B-type cytochrome subunit
MAEKIRMQLVRNHELIDRLGHWLHLANLILLILSGFQIHYQGFNVFGSINNARFVHFVDMYVFFFLGVFHVYQFIASGKWAIAGPTPRCMKNIGGAIKYYLFIQNRMPNCPHYNPLQIASYFLLFVISAVMCAVGFALYWPQQLGWIVDIFGGLLILRQVHFLLAWVFVAFGLIHLYLVFTEPREESLSMITGKKWRRARILSAEPGEPRPDAALEPVKES